MVSPRIAVLGSINMDLVIRCKRLPRPGETVLGDDLFEAPGGKGANQAVAAARLGASVSMIGRVGSDAFAERLLGNLALEGIDTSNVGRTEGCPSGVATVAIDQNGENSITVIPGANGRVSVDDVVAAADAIRAADVLLMQLEIPVESVLLGIQIAREAGTRVVLDPAPAPSSIDQGLLKVDFLCPNQTEAEAILGERVDSVEDARTAAGELIRRGVGEAIITLGSDGAVWGTRGDTAVVPPLVVEAVDSTAAGDAFAGALGVMLAEGAASIDAVRFACATGALAATKAGAQQAMPRREQVERLLAEARAVPAPHIQVDRVSTS